MTKNLNVIRIPNPMYNKNKNKNIKITRNNVLYNNIGPIYEEINNTLKIYNIDRKGAEQVLENFIEESYINIPIKQVYLVRQKDKDGNVYVLSILYKPNDNYRYRHIKIERSIRINGERGNHYIINCNIRLYNCDSIEKVIDLLKYDVLISGKINTKYVKNKELLFGFIYNF